MFKRILFICMVLFQTVFGEIQNILIASSVLHNPIQASFTSPVASYIEPNLYKPTYIPPPPPPPQPRYYVPTAKKPGFWEAITEQYNIQENIYLASFVPVY